VSQILSYQGQREGTLTDDYLLAVDFKPAPLGMRPFVADRVSGKIILVVVVMTPSVVDYGQYTPFLITHKRVHGMDPFWMKWVVLTNSVATKAE